MKYRSAFKSKCLRFLCQLALLIHDAKARYILPFRSLSKNVVSFRCRILISETATFHPTNAENSPRLCHRAANLLARASIANMVLASRTWFNHNRIARLLLFFETRDTSRPRTALWRIFLAVRDLHWYKAVASSRRRALDRNLLNERRLAFAMETNTVHEENAA